VLNDNQLAFLAIRDRCRSDKEAAEYVGISDSRVAHWKKESKDFAYAYRRLMLEKDGKLTPDDTDAVAMRVRRKLEAHAEDVAVELLSVILGEGPKNTKVAAIRLALEVMGVVGDKKTTVREIGPNLRQAVAALSPAYKAYLDSEKKTKEDVVDGEAREVG